MIEVEDLPESEIHVRQRKLLLLLNYIFPTDYEFYKNDAQQVWDLFDETTFEWPDEQFLKFTRIDHSTGMPMYKLNKNFVDHLESYHDYSNVSEFLRIDDAGTCIPKTTRHVSVRGSIASRFLENMDRIKALQTVLLLREDGPRIHGLPRDFFQELPSLQALDLSHTNISELPDSIGYAPQLKYLNLSYTSLVQLPNSICNIITLETLKVRGCLKLRSLPKSIRRLKYLKHFDVDVSHLLISMPAGVGDICQLQTLPAFVVGKQYGWHITELKNLKNLGPNLRILRLENLSSPEQAKEAALHEKNLLKKLEFHWSRSEDGFEVLESLCPSQYIEELQIVGYGGAKFPSWIGDPIFSRLTSISIHNCTKSDVLPCLAKLPSLIFLHISDMNEIKAFDQQLSGKDITDHENTVKPFAMLEQLTFNGMPELNQWVGVREGDFPCLQKLKIVDCPKLKILPKLSLFSCFQQLEISFCHSLESFLDGELPISLQSIVIIKCPMLKERFYNATEGNLEKLAHIPNIWIDHQKISLEKLLITKAKLEECQYQLGLESSDNPNITPKSPPSSIAGVPTTTRLQLLPEPGYSHRQTPLSSVSDTQKTADSDSIGQHNPHDMIVGVPAKSMDPDSFGSVAQDVHPQVASQSESNMRHFDEEITINQSSFSDVVSISDVDESYGSEKVPSVPWGSGNFPYLTETYDDSSFSYSHSLPSVLEHSSSLYFEGEDDPLPAIEGLEISGKAFPGQEIQACGYSINGTTSCNFEWVRYLEDGSVNYIDGAKEPNYLVTADDVDTYLAIEVQPLDNRKRKGDLVKVFANDQRKITCDPEMQEQIEKSLYSGHASFEVSLAMKYLDIWEPAILAIKRGGYSIKRTSGAREVVVIEKFVEKTTASIPTGHPTAFLVNEHLLRTESSMSRDIIVLTMRLFIMRAVQKSKVKKKGIFFNK